MIFLVLVASGLIFTLLFWGGRGLVTGLLSILTMFSAGAYWLVLDTSLPVLAWVWFVIAIGNIYYWIITVAYAFGNEIADRYGYRWDFLRRGDDDEY